MDWENTDECAWKVAVTFFFQSIALAILFLIHLLSSVYSELRPSNTGYYPGIRL
jgi:hypothetical protein